MLVRATREATAEPEPVILKPELVILNEVKDLIGATIRKICCSAFRLVRLGLANSLKAEQQTDLVRAIDYFAEAQHDGLGNFGKARRFQTPHRPTQT